MVLREILKTRSKDSEESGVSSGSNPPAPDIATHTVGVLTPPGKRKKKGGSDDRCATLPQPRYLFCIYSPIVFTSEAETRTEETEKLYQSAWKSLDTEHCGRCSDEHCYSGDSERLRKAKIKIRQVR